MSSAFYFSGSIIGILGEQGSGKSYVALKLALEWANKFEFDLCFNFSINLDRLYDYCLLNGYLWLLSRIYSNKIVCRSVSDKGQLKLDKWMSENKTLYVLDEAGVFLNSRRFRDVDPQFLSDLAQVRHKSRRLFWIAQYYDMVDRILRSLTSGFVHCESITTFDKELCAPKILLQKYALYNSRNYQRYLQKVADKTGGIKMFFTQRKLADYTYQAPLSKADLLLFKVYQSFSDNIESSVSLIGKKDFSKFRTYSNVSADMLSNKIDITTNLDSLISSNKIDDDFSLDSIINNS